ncbi:U4/U6 small nuclear ribonucleoprotein Prp31-like protein [Quillaja saponaria]|uniref:U4/U6 small nuclear ribonucleoprotein Prp31-like protein n=1 Tax=Quillaja saponaria TaxID=32244 RepID=A0AAD7L6D0_QUISA|nr:U4/U6 small nuclear ribonucleoprotein Prp31-like protein [Quillaja saponaria]
MENLADSFLGDLDELSDNEANIPEVDDIGDVDMESLNYDDLDSVSKLQKTQRYIDIMHKVEQVLEKGSGSVSVSDIVSNQEIGLEDDDDPEYKLFVECSKLLFDIENEIVAASTLSAKPLPIPEELVLVDACDRVLALDEERKKVLDFLESRMCYFVPNLSAVVGSDVAAKLIGTAGGIAALANMPACHVLLLGSKKKYLAGFSTATSQVRVRYIEKTATDILMNTASPAAHLRMRVCRLLAGKATLAARVDSIRGDPSGKIGRAFRDEISMQIVKWQKLPPARQPKPLPVPNYEQKKKRWSSAEEDEGKAGNGKLRVSVGQNKLAANVAKRFKLGKHYGSSGATTSGLNSSLAFTPVQGIELINPQAHAHQLGSGTQLEHILL